MKSKKKFNKKFMQRLLDDVLQPLGLCTAYGRVESSFQKLIHNVHDFRRKWFIRSSLNGGVVKGYYAGVKYAYVARTKIEDLVVDICKNVEEFQAPLVDNVHLPFDVLYVKNPYFGMPFEELCITRDLLVEERDRKA